MMRLVHLETLGQCVVAPRREHDLLAINGRLQHVFDFKTTACRENAKHMPKCIQYTSFMITVICFGALMFLIGFLGCCGALNENRCILKMFSCFSMFVILGEIGLFLVVFLLQDDIESYKEKIWRGVGDPIRIYMQEELNCCAYLDSDARIVNEHKFKSFQDASCYIDNIARTSEAAFNVSSSDIHPLACEVAIRRWLTDHLAILIVTASLFICLQLVAIAYVWLLLCSVDSISLVAADHDDHLQSRKKQHRRAMVNNRVLPLELRTVDYTGHGDKDHQATNEQFTVQRRTVAAWEN